MNKSLLVALCGVAITVVMIPIGFMLAQESVGQGLEMTLWLSLPVWFAFVMYLFFATQQPQGSARLLRKIATYGFVATTAVNMAINGFMLIDIMSKHSLGPEQGYWVLFTYGLSLKAYFWAAVVALMMDLLSDRLRGISDRFR